MAVYEINVNVNGASSGTQRSQGGRNGVGTSVAAGAVAGRFTGGGTSGTLNVMMGARGKNAADMLQGRKFGLEEMRGAFTKSRQAGTDIWSGPLDPARGKQLAKGSTKYLKNVTGKQYAGVATAGLALGISAANLYANEMSIRGNTDTSDRIRSTTDGLTEGATIVGAFALLGPIGGIAATASLAFKYAQENRKLIKELQTETIRSGYYSKRLIYDVSEVR